MLCRSPRFTVWHEWETACLEGGDAPPQLEVGYHYGDPADAAIDPGESWCVTAGHGLIAYRLAPPWIPYHEQVTILHVDDPRALKRAMLGDQWFEWGNRDGAAGQVWFERVVALRAGVFLAVSEIDVDGLVVEYIVEPGAGRVTRRRRRPPA